MRESYAHRGRAYTAQSRRHLKGLWRNNHVTGFSPFGLGEKRNLAAGASQEGSIQKTAWRGALQGPSWPNSRAKIRRPKGQEVSGYTERYSSGRLKRFPEGYDAIDGRRARLGIPPRRHPRKRPRPRLTLYCVKKRQDADSKTWVPQGYRPFQPKTARRPSASKGATRSPLRRDGLLAHESFVAYARALLT